MKLYAVIVFFFAAALICAQEESQSVKLPSGLGISNQMKYSNDIDSKREIFENWFNLDYTYGIFTAGLRFDVFQPVNFSTNWSGTKERYADIGFKYLRAEFGESDFNTELTVGNFYALFGRGMVLKSYEDRNLREDNNLLGVKVKTRYNDLTFTALSGMPQNKTGDRTDILHAADLEYKFIKQLKAGFSIASNQKPNAAASATTLTAFRIQPSLSFLDVYAEYGIKQDQDVNRERFGGQKNNNIVGNAFYGNLNTYYEGLSLSGEYKNYDNFAFQTGNGGVDYNTPPATRKDYTYMLLSRHTVSLDPANERGYSGEINYQYTTESNVLVTYGITETQPASSWYQKAKHKDTAFTYSTETQLKEFYAQILHHWSDRLTTAAAFGYNEENKDKTKNITPIIDIKYYPDDINTLHLVWEHQQTTEKVTNAQYYSDVLTLEYLRSPSLSISLLSEMLTREDTPGKKVRKLWNMLQLGYQIGDHTDLTVAIGSRQAGTICIGGVCRYEPEFSGVEFKMINRF